MFFLFFHISTLYYSISKAHARNAVKMEPGIPVKANGILLYFLPDSKAPH